MIAWLQSRLAGAAAIALALGLAWQSARIDGWPFFGGGLKAEIATLHQQSAARDLADARARSAALTMQAQARARMDIVAAAHLAADRGIQTQIQTVIEKVPAYVSDQADRECRIPWGAVRLLDAAASGAGLSDVAIRIATGVADDATSDVTLSEAVALQAGNLGVARQSAEQLGRLEESMTP